MNIQEYKECTICKESKLIATDFYINEKGKLNSLRCKTCYRKIRRDKYHKKVAEECGGKRVPATPNKYMGKNQKKCTFELMEILGYTFDKESGIWIKPGWKEVKYGKPVFLKIKRKRKTNYKVTKELIDRMLELRAKGFSFKGIARLLDISNTSVHKYVRQYEQVN